MSEYLGKYIKQPKGSTRYTLSKRINGRQIYIGCSEILELVKDLKRQCKEADWQEEEVLRIKEDFQKNKKKLEEQYNKERLTHEQYILPVENNGFTRYQVYKTRNGKRETYGTYPTLNKAILVRDKLIAHRWDRLRANPKHNQQHSKEEHHNIYYNNENNLWEIRRIVDYKLETFSHHYTLREAIQQRNHYEQEGWTR